MHVCEYIQLFLVLNQSVNQVMVQEYFIQSILQNLCILVSWIESQ